MTQNQATFLLAVVITGFFVLWNQAHEPADPIADVLESHHTMMERLLGN